ncbi:MAG: peptide chain release factor N(5)-glutamine methyltransferase [Acidobacteria bacterium]|nr:peptide chain release factor N(5)-glutamine methyltransferase [Acidobacteriota bacterium]MBA4122744.1 peptide chain release factor N(5)-glutamine methyltransferase [Acidobacteriota bacterium]
MSNISETLERATETLQASGIVEARREAKSLLAFVLDKNQTFLVAHSEYKLSAEEKTRFQTVLKRRANREPFQYIIGRQEFCGLDFTVTKDVLIPRPETEMIVEAAIEILKENARVCEVGIGSGCVCVSILHEVKTASAIGLDASERALAVAERNAKTHKVLERLELKLSNVFDNLQNEKFDLIVSNPPYISMEEMKTLQREVRDFEPYIALTDGKDGLSIVEKIIGNAPNFLKADGVLLMEIGFNQAVKVQEMFDKTIWREIEILPDLQSILRMVKAKLVKSG